ncbi:hypothetical protein A8C58_14875 [Enterococcus faecium]|nr:hypothetical protein A8C58_14875 [Enterococcus faecium]
MQINEADEDISIITKDGVVVEQQIVHQKEGYVVIKANNTCSIEFYDEDEEKEGKCYSGSKPDNSEITAGMKKECGDMEIVFVRLGHCPDEHKGNTNHADGGIQKRWTCYRVWYIRVYCGWYGCYYRWFYYYRCY